MTKNNSSSDVGMKKKELCDVAQKGNNDLESLEGNINIVKIGLKSIVRGFYTVGKTLSELQKSESYKLKGFNNFYDFTLSAFNLSRTHTLRLINVYNRFPSSKYENFSFSQLTEMLTLSDDKLSDIKPEMTVKQIREVKKKDKNDNSDNVIKKKGTLDLGNQIDAVDYIISQENKKDDFEKAIDQTEGLESANKILKGRKEAVELKFENYKKSTNATVKDLQGRIELAKSSMDNLIKRDNEKIQKLENENNNLLAQIADFQKIQKENEKLKKENEKLKKERDKLKKELVQSDKDYKAYLEEKKNSK